MKLNICKKKKGGGRGSVIYYDVCDFLYKRIECIFLPFCLSPANRAFQRFPSFSTGKSFCLNYFLYICKS